MGIPKVSLLGGHALHGLVVGVKMRVIVDLEGGGVEGRSDLGSNVRIGTRHAAMGKDSPLPEWHPRVVSSSWPWWTIAVQQSGNQERTDEA